MSTKLPIISVTTEKNSQSASDSDDDSYSNDMDYNSNTGRLTDVEDFDSSQAGDIELPRSRRSSAIKVAALKQDQARRSVDNDVTDIEDYNYSDDSEEEKSRVYPELKMSLQEFLQHGLHEQAVVDNETQAKVEMKAGSFLQAQNLNNMNDYLTDCEDYNTDSELENNCEKSVCVDLDVATDDPGRLCIIDKDKPTKSSEDSEDDDYEDVSVVSDINDLASVLSDATGVEVRGMSEDELLELSGNEEVCSIAYSGSSLDVDDDIFEGESKTSVPAIDVTFISANSSMQSQQRRRSSTTVVYKPFLDIGSINEEVLTDVERLDDSAAEEDSFDSEEENVRPIPLAVILAPGDDGTCQTDVEDLLIDELSTSSLSSDLQPVTPVIPPPHREVILLKEDKFGDTIANVMPMDSQYQFGIYNRFKDDTLTDTEDYSCGEDYDPQHSIAEETIATNDFTEGDVIVSNEVLKPLVNKRTEMHSNTESVTDVEEIYVAGTNRRRKIKTRSMSKGSKSKFLEVSKCKDNGAGGGATDIEDMDLSDCELPVNAKRSTANQPLTSAADKVTDVEDITADEVSDVSETEPAAPTVAADNPSLQEYHEYSNNSVVTLETDATSKTMTKLKMPTTLRHSGHLKDESINQPNTDVEDLQLPSDAEEVCEPLADCHCDCAELNDMLNESYTVVHEKSGNTFDVEAEKLHIKGMTELRESHTDVEYVESDESAAARGGGN